MPVLVVYGMPEDCNSGVLIPLIQAAIVADVPELQLDSNQISVFFPPDRVQAGLGEELICLVNGLLVKPERTPEVRRRLANAVCSVLIAFAKEHLPQCQCVEVLVTQFNQEKDGFATANPQQMNAE